MPSLQGTASSGGNASSGNVSSQCVVRVMRRQGVMCRQGMCRHNVSSGGNASPGVMCGQEMGRRNVSSGHVCAVRNVSSQCVVSVTAKSDTQDAGALQKASKSRTATKLVGSGCETAKHHLNPSRKRPKTLQNRRHKKGRNVAYGTL